MPWRVAPGEGKANVRFFKGLIVDLIGKRRDDFNWRRQTDVVDLDTVRNVGILHLNEKIGDAILNSRMVDAFNRARPDLPVDIGTTARFERFWRSHAGVRDVVVLPSASKSKRRVSRRLIEAIRAGQRERGRFDALVTFESFALPDHFALLRLLTPRVLIGFNKHIYRLFDHSLEEGRHGVYARHIARKVEEVMKVFGREVRVEELPGHVPFGLEDEAVAQAVVERLATPGPRLMLHSYGDGHTRILTPQSVRKAIRALRAAGHGGAIFVNVPLGKEGAFEAELREGDALDGVLLVPPLADMFGLFALVARMDVVVALDTSVGHIAAALRKPQLAVFTAEPNLSRVWRPLNDRCVVVVGRSRETVNDMDWIEFEAAARETLRLRDGCP